MKIPTPLRRSMPIQAATTQHHSAEPIGPQRMTANYPCRLFHPLAAVVVALIAMTSPARPIAQTSLPVIMSELDNLRGLAFGPDGALYVAEAGRGGAGPCRPVGAQTFCYGPTGAVSRWRNGVQQRIVEGLPYSESSLRSRSVIADHLHADAARPAHLEQITGRSCGIHLRRTAAAWSSASIACIRSTTGCSDSSTSSRGFTNETHHTRARPISLFHPADSTVA